MPDPLPTAILKHTGLVKLVSALNAPTEAIPELSQPPQSSSPLHSPNLCSPAVSSNVPPLRWLSSNDMPQITQHFKNLCNVKH